MRRGGRHRPLGRGASRLGAGRACVWGTGGGGARGLRRGPDALVPGPRLVPAGQGRQAQGPAVGHVCVGEGHRGSAGGRVSRAPLPPPAPLLSSALSWGHCSLGGRLRTPDGVAAGAAGLEGREGSCVERQGWSQNCLSLGSPQALGVPHRLQSQPGAGAEAHVQGGEWPAPGAQCSVVRRGPRRVR